MFRKFFLLFKIFGRTIFMFKNHLSDNFKIYVENMTSFRKKVIIHIREKIYEFDIINRNKNFIYKIFVITDNE